MDAGLIPDPSKGNSPPELLTILSHRGYGSESYPHGRTNSFSHTLTNQRNTHFRIKLVGVSAKITKNKIGCPGKLSIISHTETIFCPNLNMEFNEWLVFKVKNNQVTFKFSTPANLYSFQGFKILYKSKFNMHVC